ncbi:ArsA family ATPase [Kitasatospora sp. YST-16]|uniref:ArsA family ATPase n=1 Tax=unclassified Kitasatospora TaxID=2633591 RepID=UPI0004C43C07|nr:MULTISPECIES: ArsA-related P-loop ATPase [unclassified Kitasatospora]WAL71421.1 ArsA family ATPase [Kitasatospora sp. YST-16]WNW37460.1 ArsA-related P-loop ATPase [Streptomyces sp. Li-HN-5-13]
MATRTVLVSGPESGRIAAATALHHARQGSDTLLLAADDPHRAVDDLLGVRLGPEPVDLERHLAAVRLDEQAAFRAALDGYRDRLAPALDLIGAQPLDPDELAPLPGTRALALLRALPRAKAEVLVVAAPPPAELIATLALPAQLERYLARLLPEQRQAARALRPLLAGLAGVPMPTDKLFEARAAASAALAEAAAAITAPGTTVRLVLDAARPAPRALARIRAGLALHGLPLDAVVAHGALPAAATGSADPWLAAAAARQDEQLAAVAEQVGGAPVLVARQPDGDLEALAERLYAAGAPRPPAPAEPRVEDRLAEENRLVWHLPLPGADRGELELLRRGDELVLGVGGYRRVLALPSGLRRCTVSGAGLADGVLSVRFTPDPALWPRG